MATTSISEFLQDSFDFVIVGGGTAGLVLAARLSEDPTIRVGVVEAGLSRLDDPKVNLPTGPALMMGNAEYDWNYHTVPQKGAGDRGFHIPRGKMLGGCSGINFMAYGRPCAEDFDDWAAALGLKGWSWAEMLPYFMKSEKLELEEPNIKDRRVADCPVVEADHGISGPIHTSMGVWQAPFEESLMIACDHVSGISRPQNPYGGEHVGFYRSLFTTDRTRKPVRSYAGSGYLGPAIGRPNLKILTDALACRLLFADQDRKGEAPVARGVELLYGGTRHHISAKREVILSAGSLHSPRILEQSGVGDPTVLGLAGIPCLVHNADVGNNLQEHVLSAVVYELAPNLTTIDSLLRDTAVMQEHQKIYADVHSGALSGSVSLTGYVPYSDCIGKADLERSMVSISDAASARHSSTQQNSVFQAKQRSAILGRMRSLRAADIQFIGSPANFDIDKGYSDCSKLMTGAPLGYNDCYSITVSNMYPISRGTVHIQSSDPLDTPLIDPGFLSHPADVDILAAGVEFADRVFQSAVLEGKVRRRVSPGPEVDLKDRVQAREFVRNHIVTYHHALGTCAMGQVVDERLRVKGVRGVRVVDASVLPMQFSAAPLATVYAAAEKAADMIKEDLSITF